MPCGSKSIFTDDIKLWISTLHQFGHAMSCDRNIFYITGSFDRVSYWWIHPQRACNTELCYFHWCTTEQTVEQTVEIPVIWDNIMLMWHHYNEKQMAKMIGMIGYPCPGIFCKFLSHLFRNQGGSGVTEDVLIHICVNESSLWEKSYHAVHWIMYYLNTPRYQKKISNFKGDSFLHKFIHRAPTALEKSLKFSSVSRSCKNHWISWKVHLLKWKNHEQNLWIWDQSLMERSLNFEIDVALAKYIF